MNRIEGYCIIEKATGQRWGGLYESERGAKSSINAWYSWSCKGIKFDDQDEYIIQPLVLLEGENGCSN